MYLCMYLSVCVLCFVGATPASGFRVYLTGPTRCDGAALRANAKPTADGCILPSTMESRELNASGASRVCYWFERAKHQKQIAKHGRKHGESEGREKKENEKEGIACWLGPCLLLRSHLQERKALAPRTGDGHPALEAGASRSSCNPGWWLGLGSPASGWYLVESGNLQSSCGAMNHTSPPGPPASASL